MTQVDLDNLISTGEDSFNEFKSENVHSDSLAKEIVAFANTSGGSIYIGIEDDGKISGVTDLKLEEKSINICRNNIQPSIIPNIERLKYSNKLLLKISIEKGINKPYKVSTSNKFYIRVGSSSVEPTTEELVRLFQEGEIFHFEVKPLPNTSQADLNLNLFYDYCKNYRITDEEEISSESYLKNLQFLTSEGYTTIAGMLCFGKNPNQYLPQSGIALHQYSGTELSDPVLESREVEGTIPFLIETSLNFVSSHSSISSIIPEDGSKRLDQIDFDPLVVKEIIVNAFQHRDWSIFGQKIRIRMFRDRLEVFSPGKIPNTLNLQNILFGNSFYRNPLLSQIIRDYKFADKMGRGLPKAVKRIKDMNGRPLEFNTDLNSFTVTIFKKN